MKEDHDMHAIELALGRDVVIEQLNRGTPIEVIIILVKSRSPEHDTDHGKICVGGAHGKNRGCHFVSNVHCLDLVSKKKQKFILISAPLLRQYSEGSFRTPEQAEQAEQPAVV
jgi:hypothetical protein